MKQFIIKIGAFSLLILLSILGVFCLADGSTDAMYLRFTTPSQKSLIIGASRGAQGIHPKEVNRILNRDDLYNYAFQGPNSPYGEIYLESIKRKLDTSTKHGLFILDVSPWTLGLRKNSETGEEYLSEEDGFIDNTNFVSLNPNIEYLIESLDKRYSDIIRNRIKKGKNLTYLIEDDGWLHVTLKPDQKSREYRTNKKIERYTKKLEDYHGVSEYRKESLVKTIQFLKQYGQVYLVRMPVIERMLAVENQLMPNFDAMMQEISEQNTALFINMMPDRDSYSFTDGNHLDKISGTQFSKDLANKIKILQNDK
ncbi:MAG: hypothetical protein HKN51_16800 [Saprospiraceae bacterium]|nr:hypothetical protein [Saprospiraceae bacterium]